MGAKGFREGLQRLRYVYNSNGVVNDAPKQCLAPQCFSRSLATEAPLPTSSHSNSPTLLYHPVSQTTISKSPIPTPTADAWNAPVLTTLYSFPTMEPLRFTYYPWTHLRLPLRRDILHRAVIYEGDSHRQGTASTKWRDEVHGSNRKIRRQKGMGAARLGDKKSPMLRGGGVAFGPKPRDFSTELPRKIYDLAWRTALSYRYARGELIVVQEEMELGEAEPGLVKSVFERNGWGKKDGRSLLVTSEERRNLRGALEGAGEDGRVLVGDQVDVKDLLEQGRIVIEKRALDGFFREHRRDLTG
ncbi:MAG: 54S ribosomal protein, mitochondrial [Peltula sp. TS41687]|nr:MAG: 54S ribosomal protein, mitochondrial [Peltula sp. TS41687]